MGFAVFACSYSESVLLLGGSRVAPLNSVSIPRLELTAALLGARALARVRHDLDVPDSVPIHGWTDSTATLGWIKTPGLLSSLPVFVRNRVSELRSLLPESEWMHCPGSLNPADLPSRGISLAKLNDSHLWWHGPSFILSGEYPDQPNAFPSSDDHPSAALTVKAVPEEPPAPVLLLREHLPQVLRIQAFVRRFFVNASPSLQKLRGPLTVEEICSAENDLLISEQRRRYPQEVSSLAAGRTVPFSSPIYPLRPVMTSSGCLFISPRNLENSIPLLPPGPLASLVVADRHRKAFHGGASHTLAEVNRSYHIPRGREYVKRILNTCRPCRRFKVPPLRAPEAPLPLVRSQPSRPFCHIGADFFGPLYTPEKVWVLLLVCCSSRAIHLELVLHADVSETHLAFRRFAARRGKPETVFSDNASTFKALSRVLPAGVSWRFNPASAPWWGGHYERLVGACKRGLRVALRGRRISTRELEALLHELEMAVNSRPLSYVSSEDTALTPNHFVLGVGPDCTVLPSVTDPLTSVWRGRRSLANSLWTRWKTEYLPTLRTWRRRASDPSPPKPGDVLLVRKHSSPRGAWPLGRVESLIRGVDGHVRAAIIILRGRRATRPLQELYLLEVASSA